MSFGYRLVELSLMERGGTTKAATVNDQVIMTSPGSFYIDGNVFHTLHWRWKNWKISHDSIESYRLCASRVLRHFVVKNLPWLPRRLNQRPSDPPSFALPMALLTDQGHLRPVTWAHACSKYLWWPFCCRQQAAVVSARAFPRPLHPAEKACKCFSYDLVLPI